MSDTAESTPLNTEQHVKQEQKTHHKPLTKQQNRSRSQSSINLHLLQNIISSNEQMMKSQSLQMRSIHYQLVKTQEELDIYKKKCELLQQQFKVIANSQELQNKFSLMSKQIQQLQQQLIETKVELAIKSSDGLVSNSSYNSQEKDALIRDLHHKNKQLDQQMERYSSFSGGTDTNSNSEDKKQPKTHQSKFTLLEVNKQNLQQFIQPNVQSNQSILTSLRSIIDNEIFKRNTSSQIDSILKAWQKQVNEHILTKAKRFSFTSTVNKQAHMQKFLKQTTPLLKKHYGMPHIYRNKVWAFIAQDKLGISNALYIELIDRRDRGWVSAKIKQQIQNDMMRSFNGQGSKQKLLRIYQIGFNKTNSQCEQKPKFTRRNSISTIGQTQILQNLVQTPQQQSKYKQTHLPQSPEQLSPHTSQQVSKTQPKTESHFRIAQDVTQVLQLFYIYRPDIGFVQGMTYPTIVLTLVTGKLNSFRILCNLLLSSDFFKRMITFEPNFINYFCRIFDQLLLSYNLNLYNRVIRQFEIRSEVFLVDWFFTFFSRGISPMTILRIWDLLLYHSCINPKVPQLVMYRLSLIIFELLEPILMQVNYEESIRTIREYSKKLDEQELIKKLYEAMKDQNTVKTFEEKYLKVKQRVQKHYEVQEESL